MFNSISWSGGQQFTFPTRVTKSTIQNLIVTFFFFSFFSRVSETLSYYCSSAIEVLLVVMPTMSDTSIFQLLKERNACTYGIIYWQHINWLTNLFLPFCFLFFHNYRVALTWQINYQINSKKKHGISRMWRSYIKAFIFTTHFIVWTIQNPLTWSKWMNMCTKKKMNKITLATWRQQKYRQLFSAAEKKMKTKGIIYRPNFFSKLNNQYITKSSQVQ